MFLGCAGPKPIPQPPVMPRPAVLPSYRELALAYNLNVAMLDRIWCKANVHVTYLDEIGKKQTEQGDDSTLMVEVPDRLALSVGKFALPDPIIWAGCDSQQYWLFELYSKNSVIFGRHDNLRFFDIRDLPMKIRPSDLPLLLGLLPIGLDSPFKVLWEDGQYILLPPDRPMHLFLNPRTMLPTKIELFDRRGRLMVTARHSNPVPMKMAGIPQNNLPRISSRIDLTLAYEDFTMSLTLSRMTDARGTDEQRQDRAFRRAFDFDFLADKAFKVPAGRRIDLDAPGP